MPDDSKHNVGRYSTHLSRTPYTPPQSSSAAKEMASLKSDNFTHSLPDTWSSHDTDPTFTMTDKSMLPLPEGPKPQVFQFQYGVSRCEKRRGRGRSPIKSPVSNSSDEEPMGNRKRPCPTSQELPTKSSKRVYTESKYVGITRPCTPPNKIIPPYGMFSKHAHTLTPPSQVPSLCGSSIPSMNTTPEKGALLTMQHNHILASGINRHLDFSDVVGKSLKAGKSDASLVSPSLLTWLDDTADATSPKTMDSHPNEDRDLITPIKYPVDEDPQETSVSDGETWSESSSEDDGDTMMHPELSRQLPFAVKDLYKHFREWQKNNNHRARGNGKEGSQSGTLSSMSTIPSLNRINGPRTNKVLGKRRSGEDDEDRPSKNPKLNSASNDHAVRLLACPFAKKNPLQHRKCFRYLLQEIARLKQHLFRVHQVPIHCPRCSKVFDTAEARDHHSRQPECIVKTPRAFDGINESQRRLLGKRISSKKSREENWYLIYEILFPDAERPENPYIEDIRLSEELLAIREFAKQAAPARITQFADSCLPPNLRSNQQEIERFTQAAVQEVFDMMLENWDSCQSGQSSVETTPHRSTPGSNHDSGYSTTGPPSGSSYSGGNADSSFDDAPVRQFTFEPAQSLIQAIEPGGAAEQWGFENIFENFEDVPQENLFDTAN